MLDRLRHWLGLERRSVDYADPALAYLTGASRTSSGEPLTVERSVGLSATWACVSLISGTIASMPLILYKRTAEGERERYVDHPLYSTLHDRPNPVQSVVSFWEAMVVALLLRGNAFATLTRDDDNRVRALWYLNPDRVRIEITRTGKPTYTVHTGSASQRIAAENMLHITGPLSEDGYSGRSVIQTCRDVLGTGLAQERYAGEFFRNAAVPRGVLTVKSRLSDPARERLQHSLTEIHASQGRRHRTLLLEEGIEFQPLGINHQDSQFIEAKRYSTEEIARMFLVPPHLVGADIKGSMTYANAETRGLDLLKFCLGPWLNRISSAVNFSCISPLERRLMYAEFLPDALLAMDTPSRYSAYKTALEGGWLTIDEIRRKENLPSLPERVPTVG